MTAPMATRQRLWLAALLPVCLIGASCGRETVGAPEQPTAVTPPPVLAEYTGTLLAPSRLGALPPADRAAWDTYVTTSRRLMAVDRATVQQEVAAARLSAVQRPPNEPADFTPSSSWTSAWVQTTAGRTLVRAVLSYQTPAGGWGKHIDYARGPRSLGTGYNSESDEWAYVGTIDNFATVSELRLLGLAGSASADSSAQAAFTRGVRYLLSAQFPNGCWPQVYPLMGSYHDAATHNDDATANVVRLLRDVARNAWPFVTPALRADVAEAVNRAVGCLVSQQVVVQGVRTTWGQQHDPLTGPPTQGRSYEPPALSGREGSRLMALLMEETAPSPATIASVHAAAAFYRATAIANAVYVAGTGLVPTAGAAPVWARLMEVGTNKPIFANRDGVILYDHNQLTDRRTGYAWYGTEPAASLRTFESWSRTFPLPR